MSATKKTAKSARSAGSTARTATTRKRTSTAGTSRRTTTRRRTTRRTTTRRRAQPKVATTIGAGLATLAVAAFAGASWPVRIGLVMAALVIVGGYLLVQGRRHDAATVADDTPLPTAATLSTEATPPTETRPEDPA